MIFNSLTLKNFRQFGGTQTIEFSTDKNKNVTFVLAGNGVGKTTLLKAFNWCLYGTNTFDQNGDKAIAQLAHLPATDALAQGDVIESSVEINFTDNEVKYNIIRTAFYRRDVSGIVTHKQDEVKLRRTDETGISQYVNDDIEQRRIIDRILPERLSKFFFFEGESIGSMGINLSKEDTISEAIKGLLGLGYLENTRKHLKDDNKDNVIKRLKKNFSNVNGQLNIINDQINKLDTAIAEAQAEIANLENEINKEEDLISKKNEQIKNYMPTKELGERRASEIKHLEELKRDHDEKVANLRKMFNDKSYKFLLKALIKEASDALNSRKDLDSGIPDLVASTVKHILETENCICGNHLTEENKRKLTSLLKSIPPESIGTAISNFKKECKVAMEGVENFDEDMNSSIARIAESNTAQRNTEDNIKYIEEQLGSAGYMDVQSLLNEVIGLSSNMTKHQGQLANVRQKMDENKKSKEDLESKRTVLVASDAHDAIVNLRIKYAEKIYEQITQIYIEEEQKIRQELASLMMDKFEIFHGTRYGIDFDSNYNLIFTQDGKRVGMGGGHGVCIVFALVTSVIELRKRYVENKFNHIQNIEYPFVMDAPISNLEYKSIKAVCQNLPQMADQIIFMCKDQDGNTAKEFFNVHIGNYYELERDQGNTLYTRIVRK